MFRSPQVVLLCADLPATAAFYERLGFVEAFRTPAVPADPIHVDLELDGYRLGLATAASTRDHHGLDPVAEGQRAAVVLWTDDVVAAHRGLVDGGAPELRGPHVWLGRLLIAWLADPDGHAVQVVQHLGVLQHLALARDWERARATGAYTVSTLGRDLADEGFIHLSFPHQLAGVARAAYADVDEPLLVLDVDPSRLTPELRVEPGEPGGADLFPHLYGALDPDAVVGVRRVRVVDGILTFDD